MTYRWMKPPGCDWMVLKNRFVAGVESWTEIYSGVSWLRSVIHPDNIGPVVPNPPNKLERPIRCGYYWINFSSPSYWAIAWWDTGCFQVIGDTNKYELDSILEIGSYIKGSPQKGAE